MRQEDHHLAASLRELAKAAEHIGEMQDILRDNDGMAALLAAYQDAVDGLTSGLRQALTHIADDRGLDER